MWSLLIAAMRGQNAGVGGMIMTNSNMSSMQNVGLAGGSKCYSILKWYVCFFACDKCARAKINIYNFIFIRKSQLLIVWNSNN